jgi:adenosine deaminase
LKDVKVTINSDDPEFLDTNLNNEYRIPHEILGLSLTDVAVCYRCAADASFIPEAEKRSVIKKHFG